jgi:hypothetical protein
MPNPILSVDFPADRGIGGHHGRMKGADYMSAPVMVDAALAGLDLGEFVTIQSLPESSDWQTYANARQALLESKKRGYLFGSCAFISLKTSP